MKRNNFILNTEYVMHVVKNELNQERKDAGDALRTTMTLPNFIMVVYRRKRKKNC